MDLFYKFDFEMHTNSIQRQVNSIVWGSQKGKKKKKALMKNGQLLIIIRKKNLRCLETSPVNGFFPEVGSAKDSG